MFFSNAVRHAARATRQFSNLTRHTSAKLNPNLNWAFMLPSVPGTYRYSLISGKSGEREITTQGLLSSAQYVAENAKADIAEHMDKSCDAIAQKDWQKAIDYLSQIASEHVDVKLIQAVAMLVSNGAAAHEVAFLLANSYKVAGKNQVVEGTPLELNTLTMGYLAAAGDHGLSTRRYTYLSKSLREFDSSDHFLLSVAQLHRGYITANANLLYQARDYFDQVKAGVLSSSAISMMASLPPSTQEDDDEQTKIVASIC